MYSRVRSILEFAALLVFGPLAFSVAVVLVQIPFPYDFLVGAFAPLVAALIFALKAEKTEGRDQLASLYGAILAVILCGLDLASFGFPRLGFLASGEMIVVGGYIWATFGIVHFFGFLAGLHKPEYSLTSTNNCER